MKILLPLIFIFAFTNTFAQVNITLAKGQKFFVDSKVTAHTVQTLMGQSIESDASLSANYSIEVKNKQDNNYNLVNTFTKMKLKMSAMGNDMNFDSDKNEDMAGEYGASFKDIINKPKEVSINSSGKILNSSKDSIDNSPSMDPMKMMIRQLLGDPSETGYGVNLAFTAVPSKIAPGNKWTDSTIQEGVERIITYTIKEVKGNEATVVISGTLITDAKAEMQGMNIINRSKGNFSGEETIDILSGMVKQKTTTIESTGTVTITGQNMEIPVTSKITFVSSVKPT